MICTLVLTDLVTDKFCHLSEVNYAFSSFQWTESVSFPAHTIPLLSEVKITQRQAGAAQRNVGWFPADLGASETSWDKEETTWKERGDKNPTWAPMFPNYIKRRWPTGTWYRKIGHMSVSINKKLVMVFSFLSLGCQRMKKIYIMMYTVKIDYQIIISFTGLPKNEIRPMDLNTFE